MSENKSFIKNSITDVMRYNLRPQGTSPVVRLHCGDGMYVHHDFVIKCIEELEWMSVRAAVGDEPTNLEKLAYMLLCDSAYIDNKNY